MMRLKHAFARRRDQYGFLAVLLLLVLMPSFLAAANIKSKHFSVFYGKDKALAARTCKWAEAVRVDFLAALPDAGKCGNSPVRIYLREDKPRFPRKLRGKYNEYYTPGAAKYSYWRCSISFNRRLDPYGAKLSRRALREAVIRALLHKRFGFFPRKRQPYWLAEVLVAYLGNRGQDMDSMSKRLYLLPLVVAGEKQKLLPLPTLLQQSAAVFASQPALVKLWLRAQCWGLAGFLFGGHNSKPRQVLTQYLAQDKKTASMSKLPGWLGYGSMQSLEKAWSSYLLQISQKPFAANGIADNPLPLSGKPGGPARAVQAFFMQHVGDNQKARQKAVTSAFSGVSEDYAPVVSASLRSSKKEVRAMAAQACGLLGCRNALERLTRLAINDHSRMVRRAAAMAIGRLNFNIAPRELLDKIKSRKLPKIKRAAAALAAVNDPIAVDLLMRRITYQFRSTNFPRVWIQHGTTVPYVKTYQQAPGGTDLEAVIGEAREDILLQHKILVAEGTSTITEVVRALGQLVPGANVKGADEWRAWYRKSLLER